MWKNQEETHNFKEYYDCRHTMSFFDTPEYVEVFSKLAEYYYDCKAYHDIDTSFTTNCFQWIEDEPPLGVVGNKAHADGLDYVAFNIFFNTDNEIHGGTSIYRSKIRDSFILDPENLFTSTHEELNEDGMSYYDPNWQDHWTIEHILEMSYNRCVVYPGYVFHGAYHTGNNFIDNPRITQTYFLKLMQNLETNGK